MAVLYYVNRYDEIYKYDWENKVYQKSSGHFTQVWYLISFCFPCDRYRLCAFQTFPFKTCSL